MPLVSLLVPPGLLAVAAALSLALGQAGVRGGRWICAVGAWLALLAAGLAWLAGARGAVEVSGPVVLAGAPLTLRLDAVTTLFELVALLPLGLLLTFLPRDWPEATAAALMGAATLATLEAGSLLLTVLGLATCAGLGMVALCQESGTPNGRYWVTQTMAWLLLLWAAVLLQVTGATSAYDAVPVTAVRVQVFALLAAAVVLCSGLLPGRTWVSEVWRGGPLRAGPVVVALLVPLGFSFLTRTYSLGAGQWPAGWLNLALAALGAATSLGAGVRAQAAPSRRDLLAEAVPLAAGLALLALALGTPLGMVAAVVALAGLGVVAGLAPLLATSRGLLAFVGLAVAAGVPPGLLFAGWLLTLQAAVEASVQAGFVAIAGAGAWLLALAAAARAVDLPAPTPALPRAAGGSAGPLLGIAVALAAGIGVGLLVTILAVPVAAEMMAAPGRSAQPAALGVGPLGAVSMASGGWSPLLTVVPLLALGLAVAAGLRRAAVGASTPDVVRPLPPAPLFGVPLTGVPERALAVLSSLRPPAQNRTVLGPAAVEMAAARSRPWFWALTTIVLAVVVARC